MTTFAFGGVRGVAPIVTDDAGLVSLSHDSTLEVVDNNLVVVEDGHLHTGATVGDLDVVEATNLTARSPIVLSPDGLGNQELHMMVSAVADDATVATVITELKSIGIFINPP